MISLGALRFTRPVELPGESELRSEVRAFLRAQAFVRSSDAWLTGHDPRFSRALASAGLSV